MQLFYLPGTNLSEAFNAGNTLLTLPAEESVHTARVLRMKPGDQLKLTDGIGNITVACIEDPNPKACTVKLISIETIEKKSFNLRIAVTPTKNTGRYE